MIARGAAVAAMLMMAGGAAAADRQGSEAVPFRALLECRAITDGAARLACYDGKVASLAEAEHSGEVVIADRAQVRQARGQLFGYTGLRIPFLSSDDAEMPTQIEATLTGLRSLGYGRWQFVLDNGMVWRQTDDEPIDPAVGQRVIVKTAAMGSYLLKIRSRAVRVVRTQ